MTKRYRETLDEVVLTDEPDVTGTGGAGSDGAGAPPGQPCEFAWRGQRYRVVQVLGHWREDPGWWRRPDGQPIRIEQTDMWRVEAKNGKPATGVYELVRRGGEWRLDRVWD